MQAPLTINVGVQGDYYFVHICARVKSRVLLGMGNLPPLKGNPYNGYINPYYWVDEFIPYYMEIMGV